MSDDTDGDRESKVSMGGVGWRGGLYASQLTLNESLKG